MMMPKRETPQAIEEPGTPKAKYAGSFLTVLRGMVFIVTLCAFIPFFFGLLFQVDQAMWATAGVVFVLASFTLWATLPAPETFAVIGGEATARQVRMPDWSVVGYCVVIGLVSNWACVYLWFSRRYAFFSTPIIMVTGVIMALYAALAVIVGLTGRNWRTALLILLFAPGFLGFVVLRLVHFGKGF
jgi:hypothetical protein